jgi:prepilin-type N-terminal cleavage/methylation domain-containing protein
MKASKGFTLLEVAVVLAIIAILAAILTPIATSYIDQARVTRANSDVKKISQSYLLYLRDTGFYPVFVAGAQVAGNPSQSCQVSGTTPVLPSGGTNHAGWATDCSTAGDIGLIQNYVNLNTLGLSTNQTASGTAFRGPYLDGLAATDPWSQPYVVNSKYLSSNDKLNWAFAVSGGPNGQLDTDPSQLKSAGVLVTSSDDITSVIR